MSSQLALKAECPSLNGARGGVLARSNSFLCHTSAPEPSFVVTTERFTPSIGLGKVNWFPLSKQVATLLVRISPDLALVG